MKIKIYTRPHVFFAAKALASHLQRLCREVVMIEDIDPNDTTLHVIYCAFAAPALPKNYIVYQTEVLHSGWFSEEYQRILDGALAVWDYDIRNVPENIHRIHHIVPPGINFQNINEVRDIDVIHYGSINVHRRNLLNEIQNYYGIEIIENVYGEEMYALLRRAKVVLNLHFYPNAPLEVFRLYEALSYGCHVISEPTDKETQKRHIEMVYFAESACDFKICIDKALSRPFDYDLSPIDSLSFSAIKEAMAHLIRKFKVV